MPCDAFAFGRLLGFVLVSLLSASGLHAQSPGGAGTPTPAAAGNPGAAAVAEVLPSTTITGALFGRIQLSDLPGSGDVWSLIETTDELSVVDRIDNGGLYLGEPKRLGNVGSSWTQTGFTIDGLDLTSPSTGGVPLAYFGSRVLGSVQVVSSLPTVDLRGGGPTIALMPRAPAREWGGTLEAFYLPNPLQAKAAAPEPPSIARYGSAGEGSLLLSGPIGDRGGILLSGRRAQSRRFERDEALPLESRVTSLFAHALARSASGGRFRVVGSTDAMMLPFANRLRFPDRTVSARDQFWHLHGIFEQATGSGTTWSVAAGYDRGVSGSPEGMAQTTVGVVERLRDGPVQQMVAASSGVQQRLSEVFRVRPDLRRVAGGRHTLDLGFSLNRTIAESDAMPRAVIGELVDGLPARAWDYTWGGASRRTETDLAGWANDSIQLFSRMVLEGGARFELTRADGVDNPTGIRWKNVLPRGLLRVNVTASGSLSMYTGYGVYRHRLPLDYLAYGDTSAPSALVHRWNDRNGDRQLQLPELGSLIAYQGPGARQAGQSGIDPNLSPPLSKEFALGVEARFGRNWRGRIAAIERRLSALIAPVDVGVTLDSYTFRDIPDRGNDFLNPADDRLLRVYNRLPSSFGRDRYLLTNPEGQTAYGVALDLALERVFDGRWYMMFAASAQRSDGDGANPGFLATENDTGVLGTLFEDPNALTYARGRLFFERGYIIKWSGGLVTSNDFHFGAIARYQDGQHFARLVVVPDLNQGPEIIQAYTRGHSRFTFTFTLDARAEKGFRAGRGRVALVAEAFNLLNNRLEVEEDPVVTRSFRATTAVQPPRAIRLGVKVEF